MNRILIINPFGIGDVLFTTPLISHLREAYPGAFIGYVANRRALPVVECNPKVNKVYVYERDEFKKNLSASWIKFYREIKSEGFEVVLDFSLNASFGFFTQLCGIKRRIGYDYRGRGRFLTDKIHLEGYQGQHVVVYYLELLKVLGIPISQRPLEIFTQNAQGWAKAWMKEQGIDVNRPRIAVIPGGGASWGKDAHQKRWPEARYASLVDKIVAKSNAAIILMGDAKEQPLGQAVMSQCRAPLHNAMGKTTVLQMAALLQTCTLAIVNDGGPLHLAVAAGVKTVSIFGPVDPIVYGPYPSANHVIVHKDLPCQPCYRRFRKAACDHIGCLNDLSVDEVFNQIERLL